MQSKHFIFRSNQTIGAAAAELDENYLRECFVDTGVLDILLDCEDHRSILVGRTGAGKSALIAQILLSSEHAIQIRPESLSLAYISNSNVINFFLEAGVNLNPFYRLLWKHIFIVEILKERFDIDNEQKKQNFLTTVWNSIHKNRKHEMALDYLKEWGDSFWQETDFRVKEVTRKLEEDLTLAAKSKLPDDLVSFDASSISKLSNEQKADIVHKGQKVVSQVQINKLDAIMDFLDEILADRQKQYHIVIDKLDENWVENKLQLQLIRALIDTTQAFHYISNVKIIIALRNDLLDRVYKYTRDSGFQEEKLHSSSLNLTWSKTDLIKVLDTRIDKLVRSQYTKEKVTHNELLNPIHLKRREKTKTPAIDYMIERTLLRPRDLIQFFNECILLSNGETKITNNILFSAEGNYSRQRFFALRDEWMGIYPNLALYSQILKAKKSIFKVKDIPLSEIEDICLTSVISPECKEGEDKINLLKVAEGKMQPQEYRKELIFILYKVGLIGLKPNISMPVFWSYHNSSSISEVEINNDSIVHIQKTFSRYFGIQNQSYKSETDDGQ
jgi:hypothetical protein